MDVTTQAKLALCQSVKTDPTLLMMKSIYRTITGFILLFVSTQLMAENGITDTKIVIGQSAALTGPEGNIGLNFRAGAEAYFDKVNKAGGVYGRQIILHTLDDGYDQTRAESNTKLLVEEEKVFALFGYVGTSPSLAAKPYVTNLHIPFIAPVSGSESLRSPFTREIINVRASFEEETSRIVQFLGSTLAKKIAVFYQDDEAGKSGLAGVIKQMDLFERNPVATASVNSVKNDVSAAVKVIGSKNPDAVIMISTSKNCSEFIRQIRKTNPGIQFWTVSYVGTKSLIDDLGEDGRGVGVSQIVPFPYQDAIPVSHELHSILKEKTSFLSLEGYIAAKVFVEGLKRAGKNVTRESLISAMEKGEIDVGGYKVNYSPSNHSGSSFVDTTVITRGGKIIQ